MLPRDRLKIDLFGALYSERRQHAFGGSQGLSIVLLAFQPFEFRNVFDHAVQVAV
jgi:hypothetical protein